MTGQILHQPVLLQEAISLLNIKPNKAYLDCTLGQAGHAEEILNKGGKVYGLDVDPDALKRAENRLKTACPPRPPTGGAAFFQTLQTNFSEVDTAAKNWDLATVAGILFDLGLSSQQLASKDKGFSFKLNAPLDMRADPKLSVTAADLINGLTQKELAKLFKKYGEEPRANSLSRKIVQTRQIKKITTTSQLADLVAKGFKRGKNLSARWRIHPATKVFQALRIAVNDELNNLKTALPKAVKLLKPSGRLVVISFHSLEDRIVKNFIKNNKNLTNLTKKPITPKNQEIIINPRARSAKLRAAEKL